MKPLDRDRILVTVRNALQTWQLQREVEQLRAGVEHRYEMIGESPAIRSLFAQLEKTKPDLEALPVSAIPVLVG